MQQQAGELDARLAAARHTAGSDDRWVTAVVTGQGRLLDLRIDDRALHDVFTSKEVVDAVVDAFATVTTAITGLFDQTISTLGSFRAQATAIVQGDTNFPDLPPMPANSGMDNEKQWRIDPSAAPA